MDTTDAVQHTFHYLGTTFHIVIMLIGGAVLLFILLRFFLRPVSNEEIKQFLHAELLEPLQTSLGQRSGPEMKAARERDTFIVIPDISGYTRYMRLSRFSADHAQYLVAELLQALIEAARPVLRATRIEGDAVVLHAISARDDPRRGVSGAQLGLTILGILNAFYQKRAELKRDNACPCEACRHIDDLEVKVIVHRGPVVHYRLKALEDLSGIAVIVAHRLLKNTVDLDRYILLSEAAAEIELPLAEAREQRLERYDDIGAIATRVYDFEPAVSMAEPSIDHHAAISRRMRDGVRKLRENMRTLIQSVGPRKRRSRPVPTL